MAPLQTPDAALTLLTLGILLLYLEANRPGRVLPGAFGLLLALLSINTFLHLPVFLPALALLPLALAFIPAAIAVTARLSLVLTTLATATLNFLLHHLILFPPGGVHLLTAMLAAGTFSAASVWLGRIALAASRNKRILRPAA